MGWGCQSYFARVPPFPRGLAVGPADENLNFSMRKSWTPAFFSMFYDIFLFVG
jgi:hypothetical protein